MPIGNDWGSEISFTGDFDGQNHIVSGLYVNDVNDSYPQPYFMHFVLEAINKVGLFEKYGLDTIRLWEKAIDNDKCALKEGWIPVNSYAFDLSHAWGGSPTYQLPARLLGIDMIEPGWKKIKINPCLYGLDFAEISIPTPFGMFICRMDNKETELHVPQGIEIIK